MALEVTRHCIEFKMPAVKVGYKRKELNTIVVIYRRGYSPKTSIHDTDCSYTTDDERGTWDSLIKCMGG